MQFRIFAAENLLFRSSHNSFTQLYLFYFSFFFQYYFGCLCFRGLESKQLATAGCHRSEMAITFRLLYLPVFPNTIKVCNNSFDFELIVFSFSFFLSREMTYFRRGFFFLSLIHLFIELSPTRTTEIGLDVQLTAILGFEKKNVYFVSTFVGPTYGTNK